MRVTSHYKISNKNKYKKLQKIIYVLKTSGDSLFDFEIGVVSISFDVLDFITKQNRKPIVSLKYSSNQNAGQKNLIRNKHKMRFYIDGLPEIPRKI
ncbi:hypothetical protein BpHYR1_021584 [Brachionus plicatilis]|uniref:Uncharacterized protein n=1 Tax=Brachionus plicatilis TaxID=10195 RepID=A0A3M7SUM3_BRAPC|nr:hypothetical protein BpHYR1_021584 [Brachionus plicatilis]